MNCLGTTPRTCAVGDRHGAVEQAVADRHRQADDDELRPAPRSPRRSAAAAAIAGLEQGRLAEQVGAGVAGEAQLGEDDDVAVGHLAQDPDDLASALASGSATTVLGDAQVTRTNPNLFMTCRALSAQRVVRAGRRPGGFHPVERTPRTPTTPPHLPRPERENFDGMDRIDGTDQLRDGRIAESLTGPTGSTGCIGPATDRP